MSRWGPYPGDPPWLVEAFKDLGLREVPGRKHNSKILGWLRRFGVNIGRWGKSRDETPWCAVFVSAKLHAGGYHGTDVTDPGRAALARSYCGWGKPGRFQRGAIVVLRKNTGPDERTGSRGGYHVGFLISSIKSYYIILGGNQRNQVRVSFFPKSKYSVVGMRWPRNCYAR